MPAVATVFLQSKFVCLFLWLDARKVLLVAIGISIAEGYLGRFQSQHGGDSGASFIK